MKKFLIRHRDVLIPVLFLFAATSITFFLLPPAPVWITDSGNKYMIMRNLAGYGMPEFIHPLPELFHFCGFHFQQLATGSIHSFFPPFLSALSVPLWKIAGDISVVFFPMLCGAIVLFYTIKLSRKTLFPALGLICCSPLLFYSVQMWEMIPAAAALTAAAWYFCRKKTLLAGMIFGYGIWMREEMYLLGAIFGTVLFFQKRYREMFYFFCGATASVLPLWIINFHVYNNIFGIHGIKYFVNNRPETTDWLNRCREITFNFYQQLIRFEVQTKLSAILSIIIAVTSFAVGCTGKFCKWYAAKLAVIYSSGVIALILGGALFSAPQPLFISSRTAGLVVSFTLMIPVLANWRALLKSTHKNISLAAKTLFVFVITVPFFLNPHDIGLTWGSRHYIIIMPLLALLADYALIQILRHRQLHHTTSIFLWLPGIIMQLWAIYVLISVSHHTAELDKYLQRMPEKTVVSDLFFLPEMTPRVPQQKIWLEITDMQRTGKLLEYLQKEDIPGFTLVLSPQYRRLPNQALAELLKHYPPTAQPQKYFIAGSLELFIVYCAKNP